MNTDAISRQVQAAYDQIVEAFASRNHGQMADNLVALAEKLALHVGPGARILEVGCGSGRDMAWFEAHGLVVTGIDLSGGMLAYARQVVDGSLLQMDMTQMAFEKASFDSAWCCAALLHLPKFVAPKALEEIRRVLRPGAMLMLSIQEGDGERWEEGYVEGVQRFYARYSQEEIVELLAQCGFLTRETTTAQTDNRHWLALVCIRA